MAFTGVKKNYWFFGAPITPLITGLVGAHPFIERSPFLGKTRSKPQQLVVGFLRGVVVPPIFPKVPQSSQTESFGFPSYPPPFEHP